MNVHNLEILNLISSYINDDVSTSDSAITSYLIDNIDRISEISINDIIMEAHVSRSSIRRYCHQIGYDNFSDFKQSFSDISFPSNIHLRDFMGSKKYQKELSDGLAKIFTELNDLIMPSKIDHLTDLLATYKNVYIFSASNTSTTLLKFQQELFYAKKVVRLLSVNKHLASLKDLVEEDALILVVSASGLYANLVAEQIKTNGLYRVLITGNQDKNLTNKFDETLSLSKVDTREDKYGLLGKYAITYLFDLISENYIYRYKKDF